MDSDIKVLVVDNSAPMRRSIRGIFSQIGFKNIIWAGDGSEALEKLGKEKAGLIVSDWDMPKMNGLELLKAVKAGVSGDITRPFTFETVSRKVKKLFES